MSFQSIGSESQPPGSYRHEFLRDLLSFDGRSGREIARAAGISHTNFYEVLEGHCIKIPTLGRVVEVFQQKFPKLKMKHVFDDDLTGDRFRRTVLRGGAAAGR